MTTTPPFVRNPSQASVCCKRMMLAVAILLTASGCASKAYVALLEQQNGETGKIIVTQGERSVELDQPGSALALGSSALNPLEVSAAQINADFGSALRAQPTPPESFTLYFEGTSTRLTPASTRLVTDILESIRARATSDVSITGHTDRAGDETHNQTLGLERARAVREMLASELSRAVEVTVASHGERNLLVPTADDVPEPRNRRVEITIR